MEALAAALRDGVAGHTTVDETERTLAALAAITPDGIAVPEYMRSHDGHNEDGYHVGKTIADELELARGRVRVALRRRGQPTAVGRLVQDFVLNGSFDATSLRVRRLSCTDA